MRPVLLALLTALRLPLLPATAEAAPTGLTRPTLLGRAPAAPPAFELAKLADDTPEQLMVKLQMAQFHHLRAMHGITWSMVVMLTTPGIAVLGGGLLIGGAISGIFTGDTGVLVAGVVIVVAAAIGFGVSIPALIGNLVQAAATAARVEDLRRRLLDDPTGMKPEARVARPVGLRVAFAF